MEINKSWVDAICSAKDLLELTADGKISIEERVLIYDIANFYKAAKAVKAKVVAVPLKSEVFDYEVRFTYRKRKFYNYAHKWEVESEVK